MKTDLTRRQFLTTGAVAGAGLFAPFSWTLNSAWAFAQSDGLKKFIQPMRGEDAASLLTEIGVAAPDPWPAPMTGVTHYTVNIEEFTDELHPTFYRGTKLWGFKPRRYLSTPHSDHKMWAGKPYKNQGASPRTAKHLGGMIVAQRGVPLQISFINKLPRRHILPVDATIMGADHAQNRAAVHLHGGFVPWVSDGGPFAWFEPAWPLGNGAVGDSFLNNAILNPWARPGEAEYYYPNNQSARLMWYHDHAWGITRINAYAGLATAYIIRDAFEASLVARKGLPDFIENGGFEMPLIIQDKIFVSHTTGNTDPSWFTLRPDSRVGDLWYDHVYDPALYGLEDGIRPLPDPSVIPEFFGDTMLANGTVFPQATVEARRYRLRILNACNARFLNLQLYIDDGSTDGITLDPMNFTPTNEPYNPLPSTGLAEYSCLQIGTEGGFMPMPVNVRLDRPFDPETLDGSLILAPAERADLIIDFTGYQGKKLILYNDAPSPFPSGSPLNDYFPGNPDNPTQPNPGYGPNTRQIVRFKVVPATGSDSQLWLNSSTDLKPGIDPLLVAQTPGVPTPVPAKIGNTNVKVRQLTLNESIDEYGRLMQLQGTNVLPGAPEEGFGRGYLDSATEVIKDKSIEVWEIANLSADTHPIHFHLINVQVLSRQPFDADNYNGTPVYLGPAFAPADNELGWKETVQMNPGEVTRVIAKFELPKVPFKVPSTPRIAPTANQPGLGINLKPGSTAHEYVYHCHILEHEEHDMMRPLIVVSADHDGRSDHDMWDDNAPKSHKKNRKSSGRTRRNRNSALRTYNKRNTR